MKLLQILSRRGRADAIAKPGEAPNAGVERLLCGWYDSSHDLRQGLVVHEDDGAGELPLALWLEAQLRGWDGAVPT